LVCPLPSQATGPAPLSIPQLTSKAGFIFAGRVLRVDRPSPLPGRVPLVHVTLQVDRALRGVRRGQTFTLTQWTAAWENGPQFRPGQRLLLFLYPVSRAGLTSVVGGRLGQFDLDPAGNIVLRGDQQHHLFAPEDAPAAPARALAHPSTKFHYRDFARRVRQAADP
jgi:hypothetical protein